MGLHYGILSQLGTRPPESDVPVSLSCSALSAQPPCTLLLSARWGTSVQKLSLCGSSWLSYALPLTFLRSVSASSWTRYLGPALFVSVGMTATTRRYSLPRGPCPGDSPQTLRLFFLVFPEAFLVILGWKRKKLKVFSSRFRGEIRAPRVCPLLLNFLGLVCGGDTLPSRRWENWEDSAHLRL